MGTLAIQFVLMVCGGVYPAIQPMGTTCGEASSTEEDAKTGKPTKKPATQMKKKKWETTAARSKSWGNCYFIAKWQFECDDH